MGTVTGRCVIWGAAPVGPAMLKLLRPGDHIIAADGGWVTARSLGVQPHCILGDFDSAPRPDDPDAIVLPTVKDDTDTQYATRLALEDGYTDIRYLGVLGGKRLDHTLANIQALAWARAQGAECFIIGEGCALTAIADGDALRFDDRYRGDFSAFCHGPDAAGVSERGLYYRLDRAVLPAAFPLGVSNSFTGEAAEISVGRGTLIVYWQDDPALPLPERGKI